MKSIFINLGISILCSPVTLILNLTIHNPKVLTGVSALWVGICLSCLVNGVVNIVKYNNPEQERKGAKKCGQY